MITQSPRMKEVALYGGAAKCMIPSDWVDASSFRDVPDHQEVFMHPHAVGEQSVIIEILEYDQTLPDDKAAAYYFNDLANADGASSTEIDADRTRISTVNIFGTTVPRCDIAGIHMKAKLGPNSPTKPVVVLMSVIRAVNIHSDILVTSHALPEYGSAIRNVHESVLDSLRFIEKSLFV